MQKTSFKVRSSKKSKKASKHKVINSGETADPHAVSEVQSITEQMLSRPNNVPQQDLTNGDPEETDEDEVRHSLAV